MNETNSYKFPGELLLLGKGVGSRDITLTGHVLLSGSAILNHTMDLTDNVTTPSVPPGSGHTPVGLPAVIGISILFCLIGLVGILGNSLVVLIVLTDRKMRYSVTNLFITNLALSDLLIMLCGVPETAQFMLNRGWLLGEAVCKLERYVLVVSLYSSVITLVAVCIER